MTTGVIAAIISALWLLAAVSTAYSFINVSEGMKMLEYGICVIEDNSLSGLAFALILATIADIINANSSSQCSFNHQSTQDPLVN